MVYKSANIDALLDAENDLFAGTLLQRKTSTWTAKNYAKFHGKSAKEIHWGALNPALSRDMSAVGVGETVNKCVDDHPAPRGPQNLYKVLWKSCFAPTNQQHMLAR